MNRPAYGWADLTFPPDYVRVEPMRVELVNVMADDANVVNAARVSTLGSKSQGLEADAGLINFLMRERHACYDDETEVFTSKGWKAFPLIDGSEIFMTRTLDGRSEWQTATAVTHEEFSGSMVRIKSRSADLLVTPNHRLLASPRINGGYGNFEMIDATLMHDRSYRLPKAGSIRIDGIDFAEAWMLGFTIADGHVSKTGLVAFNLRKERKINELLSRGGYVTESRYAYSGSDEFRRLALLTYGKDRQRVIPQECIETWSAGSLAALIDGLEFGDGHTTKSGKSSISTVSKTLADQIQGVGALIDLAVSIRHAPTRGFGTATELYTVTLFRNRDSFPVIGKTKLLRSKEVTSQPYSGMVHCVTVPNGVLFVRRNNQSMWCGNSPFEHNVFTFFIEAPIFVTREIIRHRISAINEESGRYKQLEDKFYYPTDRERPLRQVGKTGHYIFETAEELRDPTLELLDEAYGVAWENYNKMLQMGVAKEVARMALPVGIYSSMYFSINARSLMNFLSLRTAPNAQWEIRQVARQMEQHFATSMPLTYLAWTSNGRKSI